MSVVINLYLYKLQKEVKAALEKQKTTAQALKPTGQQPNDFSVLYGEHFCPELIPFLYKSKG
ncbi:MAG: hypothetical protein FH756_13505 [Firmicutes bacterium]|nr:hypothetical protein [Bacillota bacterium]